jgi:hypothetical protein
MSKKFTFKNEDAKCAASKNYDGVSCFTVESLIRMVIAYNVKCSKIGSGTPIDIREDKHYLVKSLTKAMESVCSDQICWINQDFIKELNDAEIDSNTFRPKITQGRFDWLNTTNIKEAMEQYESKYKDFKFYGAVPMDFDDLPTYGIRNINFDELRRSGTNRLGFIFNMDESWQRGSHWVAMFADIKKNQIYYFDSYGTKPKAKVRRLINRIATWCYKRNVKNDEAAISESVISNSFMKTKKNYIEEALENINYNKTRHQFKNSECGVYSMNFILRLLKGESFQEICDNITSDDDINQCRPVYYRFK